MSKEERTQDIKTEISEIGCLEVGEGQGMRSEVACCTHCHAMHGMSHVGLAGDPRRHRSRDNAMSSPLGIGGEHLS
jgi:hypothetical protein